jgi:hypothetical protein
MLGFIIRSRTIRMTLVFVKIKKKNKKKVCSHQNITLMNLFL